MIRGFPKIRDTFLGVPIVRTLVFLGSILGAEYDSEVLSMPPLVLAPM